jgi:hypothetical protein
VVQKVLLVIYLLWHGIEISGMIAPISNIYGIPVLGCLPSWCSVRFAGRFVVLHSTANNRGWVANFTGSTFAKWELAMNTLHEVKSVKTTLSKTCFFQMTKSNQDLV